MSFTKGKNYIKIKELNTGSTSKVYLTKNLIDQKLYVLKEFNSINSIKDQILNEVEIMKSLNHENIIKFYDFFLNENNRFCLIMEYAEHGDLFDVISKQHEIPSEIIIHWFKQICQAVKVLHDNKIIHRDLKVENIFLSQDNKIKLGDFGIAIKMKDFNHRIKKGGLYTLECAPPEFLKGEPYNNKADIWALGIVLYTLCCLKRPFDLPEDERNTIIQKIKNGKYESLPGRFSNEIDNLISWLLQKNPELRPDIQEILDTKIIKQSNSINKEFIIASYKL